MNKRYTFLIFAFLTSCTTLYPFTWIDKTILSVGTILSSACALKALLDLSTYLRIKLMTDDQKKKYICPDLPVEKIYDLQIKTANMRACECKENALHTFLPAAVVGGIATSVYYYWKKK